MKRNICAIILALGMLLTSASALTVEQARELLDRYYIDEIPKETLEQDTIEGILTKLNDPYTTYYTAEELAGFYADIEDVQLVGIGIRCYYLAEGVLVTQVAPHSPAEEVGLQPGDYIIGVDGNDTRGALEEDVTGWLQGKTGTRVLLTVLRGEETFAVTAVRSPVVFPTVWLEKVENGIGWISCSSFGTNSFLQFYEIITTHDSEVDGWVVDLRDNSGGNALTAALSAGCFGGWGSGVYMRDRSGQYFSYRSSPELLASMGYDGVDLGRFDKSGRLSEDAVCVLTSKNSASAAELFCAAIRDSGSGIVVGERTYGKGVAQALFDETVYGDYFKDGDGLKVTTERCYSVKGGTYDKIGILPHVLVDSEWADEAATLLLAPVSEEEDALCLFHVGASGSDAGSYIMPLEVLRDPVYAETVSQMLSRLPNTVTCKLRLGGVLWLVTVETAAEACGVQLEKHVFSDLNESNYSDAVDLLGVHGIVNGCGDGMFRPLESLSRAEMCAFLVQALRYPVSDGEERVFLDVPADAWYTPYVNTMYELGLVNGCGDGRFCPEEPVSHEQFLTVVGRVARWMDMDCYELLKHDGIYGDRLPSADILAEKYSGYSQWAREMIWLCDGDYVWTDLSAVEVGAPTTREEAAATVYKLFQVSGILPAWDR